MIITLCAIFALILAVLFIVGVFVVGGFTLFVKGFVWLFKIGFVVFALFVAFVVFVIIFL